jgi:thiamine-monophosphate kinase
LQLAKADLVRSAIDISDGLLQDAEQMARASGCGMELDFDALPLWSGHADPLTQATGGDDYSLLVALKPGDWAAAQFALPDLHPIGRCCEGEGVVLRDAQGRVMPLGQKGWEHAG